jgi:hypothetical protein
MTEGIIDALAIARTEFERRLTAITDYDWGRPTPCTEWNVRQLVNHIVSHEYGQGRPHGIALKGKGCGLRRASVADLKLVLPSANCRKHQGQHAGPARPLHGNR